MLSATQIPITWSCTRIERLVLYRAVDMSPGHIKFKGALQTKSNAKLALQGARRDLLSNSLEYAQAHVSCNKGMIQSCGYDEECCGYKDSRRYVYRFTIPNMFKFEPPAGPAVTCPPIIFANTDNRSLSDATMVAFAPQHAGCKRGERGEVDLIFDIELSMIDAYKPQDGPQAGEWVAADWATIQPELP